MKAATTWLAEAHGKPAATQRIEAPAQVPPMTVEELEAELGELEGEYGQEARSDLRRLPEETGG